MVTPIPTQADTVFPSKETTHRLHHGLLQSSAQKMLIWQDPTTGHLQDPGPGGHMRWLSDQSDHRSLTLA